MRSLRPALATVTAALVAACTVGSGPTRGGASAPEASAPAPSRSAQPRCGDGASLRVRFYDVGQALAALVVLPDGRHVLVDAGEAPARPGCGAPCAAWHAHLLEALDRDLDGGVLDVLWITHSHSDHVGGAPDVLARFHVLAYVDNGLDDGKPSVTRARDAARSRATAIVTVDPHHTRVPLAEAGDARLAPFVPAEFPPSCRHNPNDCSIGLRIDFCASSALFTGDAEHDEEEALRPAPVTLLQVGHHGSETSSSATFLEALRPRYAVISAAHPDEGTNLTYCHPRGATIERVTRALGRGATRIARAFDGAVACRGAAAEHWLDVAASDRLWITARDGDVTLETRGDGVFRRVDGEQRE